MACGRSSLQNTVRRFRVASVFATRLRVQVWSVGERTLASAHLDAARYEARVADGDLRQFLVYLAACPVVPSVARSSTYHKVPVQCSFLKEI